MDRTERFYRIETLIRHRRSNDGYISFAELMKELEVSRATLKRDLEYLRSRLNAPIVYDRASNGYRFNLETVGSAQAHQLPGIWFNESELHALLTMHQLIKGLDNDGVLARHLQPVLDKLHGMLGTTEVEANALHQRIRVASPARRPVPGKHFELVGTALSQRKRLALVYFARDRAEETTREVSPQRLVYNRNTWYLDAWCHTGKALRRFSLDAIRQASLLEQKAPDIAIKTIEAELDGGYGVYGGGTIRHATLVFTASAARWVADELWHPAQQSRWLDDGSYELVLPYSSVIELGMDVMRHGSEVEVMGDVELRRHVADRTRAAAEMYA